MQKKTAHIWKIARELQSFETAYNGTTFRMTLKAKPPSVTATAKYANEKNIAFNDFVVSEFLFLDFV